MVGISGGVPPKVRLGDVIIRVPVYDNPGVVQWEFRITQQGNSFKRIGALNKAPDVLRTVISKLEAQHKLYGSSAGILSILDKIPSKHPLLATKYLRSDNLEDVLFRADYDHVSQKNQKADGEEEMDNSHKDNKEEEEEEEESTSNCRYCDRTKAVKRKTRVTKIKVHHGLVASGNSVIKNAKEQDEINKQRLDGLALCFEIEAAGISSSHPCLVIRGICGESSLILLTTPMLISLLRLLRYAQE